VRGAISDDRPYRDRHNRARAVPKKLARSHQPRAQNGESHDKSDTHLAALDLSKSTKDAWLITHSQNLRIPLMSMGSMLGLMELGHKLASVRPLYEEPSDFDETAFRRLRTNYQHLVRFFNELADLTWQVPLQLPVQLESGPPPIQTSLAAFINPLNNSL